MKFRGASYARSYEWPTDDEERWLEVWQRHPYDEVERLVGRASAGQRLDADPHADAAAMTELRLNLSPYAMQVIERAIQGISLEAGRALHPAQALEYLCGLVSRHRLPGGAVPGQPRRPTRPTRPAALAK